MKFAAPLVLAGVAAAGYLSSGLKGYTDTKAGPSGLDAHETNAGASVLGQFRTSTTAWLWLRTDLYLHNGVEMRTLSAEETLAGHKGVGSADEELGAMLNDDHIVTLIPSKDRDFRGILGDIERATQTYAPMEGHTHNTPADALPLFRLMTWIDPQFVPGWTTAATIVAGKKGDAAFDKGLALLEEGLDANPNNITLLNEVGRFHAGKRKDYAKALPYLLKAIAQPVDVKKIDEDDAESLLNAYRWTAMCFRETGQPDKQRQVAKHGLELFAEDRVLTRLAGGSTEPIPQEDHHEHDH